MKQLSEKIKYIAIVNLLAIVALIVTYAHYGNILVDCGREVYYPVQVLQGKILYKDIFNIYGPFSYQLNAGLFRAFGINLNVLYLMGSLCAILIANLIYFISKRFCSNFLSFSIAVFTVAVGILNTSLFNFVFPYSYSILYGLVGILASIFLFLKYRENPKANFYLYLCCFFAGLGVVSKYEFVPYILVLSIFIFRTKKFSIKEIYYILLSLVFVPAFCFGILFLQGLHFSDLKRALLDINLMAHTQTLKYYYTGKGVYFNPLILPLMLLKFVLISIPLFVFDFGFKKGNKWLSAVVVLGTYIFLYFFLKPDAFIFIPTLIFLITVFNYKKISTNSALLFLILTNFLISLKVFWGMATLTYGVFFLSLNLLTIISLILYLNKERNINEKRLGIFVILMALIIGCNNYINGREKSFELETKMGGIYLDEGTYYSTRDLLDYLNNNVKSKDEVVIYPEGTFINFLISKNSDNYYSSLIPLYYEIINENKMISHFKKTKPKYIIFNNWDMSKDYYFKTICNDYAFGFCSYVSKNYTQVKLIDGSLRYLVYKLK